MRWLVAPLIAVVLVGASGFLDGLERTTEASLELAESSREAPADTRRAAREVSDIPAIAELTTRQADAFRGLADALEVSAERVFQLNSSLDEQAGTIGRLRDGITSLRAPIDCVEARLRLLLRTSGRVPPNLDDIRASLIELIAAQNKSIRHLKSINRKLTALGVAAEASDVKVPPPPEPAAPTDIDVGASSRGC
jgi:hypothetical protein